MQTEQDFAYTDRALQISEEEPKRASLLALPAELRNQIWRLVLLEAEEIHVRPERDATQPGLLCVSRQLRAETKAIYGRENKFAVFVRDLKVGPYNDHWVWRLSGDTNLRIVRQGRLSWPNFKQWLRLFWDKQAEGMGPPFENAMLLLCNWRRRLGWSRTCKKKEHPGMSWKRRFNHTR